MSDEMSEPTDEDMLTEYDFSGGTRGKHAREYRRGVAVTVYKPDGTSEKHLYDFPEGAIILDPDIRPYFPNAEAVNRALRGLIDPIPRDHTSQTIHQAVQ
jgi:hypothetical protein